LLCTSENLRCRLGQEEIGEVAGYVVAYMLCHGGAINPAEAGADNTLFLIAKLLHEGFKRDGLFFGPEACLGWLRAKTKTWKVNRNNIKVL
jgi:hypothetical protein